MAIESNEICKMVHITTQPNINNTIQHIMSHTALHFIIKAGKYCKIVVFSRAARCIEGCYASSYCSFRSMQMKNELRQRERLFSHKQCELVM